jgi:hypothetical protein
MDNKITLYINTIKYLKPSQIYYRLSNRMKRNIYKSNLMSVNIPKVLNVEHDYMFLIPELDFDKDYLSRFDVGALLNNEFTFINITNKVELSKSWNDKNLQHLWRYNLHYFDYLFKLAIEYLNGGENHFLYYEKYKTFISNWIENNPFPLGDGWHPYTISLRITNWIITYQIFREDMTIDNEFHENFKRSLYVQYKYLQANLEKDVLGNHYFENIKALIIGSIFFMDKNTFDKFKKELLEQLDEQILLDGMHFELSPMYHKIILEDLIKITWWLKDEDIYNLLNNYLQKMIDVTYSFEDNFGKTPAFNDSTDGISKSYQCLLKVCNELFELRPQNNTSFEKSGFYILKDKNKKVIFDTGDICPTYLPAHGHCDALSYELSIKGTPLIVNAGTYRYESGEWRDYFRSTNAHNTVSVSNKEQSQFWGSFRVAKRIKKVRRKQFLYKNINFYAGAYVSYLGVEHKRFIAYIDENTVVILDYVDAKPNDEVKSYVHFVPGVGIDIRNDTAHVSYGEETIKISEIGTSLIDKQQGWYSREFNIKDENSALTLKKDIRKKAFGYLIELNKSNAEIVETEKLIKIIGSKELIIDIEELGEFL